MDMAEERLTCEYNGVDLSHFFRITRLDRDVSPARENITQSLGISNGDEYVYARYDKRYIEMDITVIADDFNPIRETLGKIFNVDEPKELVFSDQPTRVWYAVIDGKAGFEEVYRVGAGTVTFLIPAGVSYARDSKEYQATLNSSGFLSTVIHNEGSTDCAVDIRAEFQSDNGVFAAVSEYGIVEVGSMEEVDGHSYQVTDVVAKNTLNPADKANWLQNSSEARVSYPIAVSGYANSVGTGSFSWPTGSESPTPSYSGRGANKWAGPTLHRKFNANSNGSRTGNFEAMWRFSMKTTKPSEVGRQEFNLQNGSDVPFAFVIRDSASAVVEAVGEFKMKPPGEDWLMHSFRMDLKKITGSWFEIKLTRMGANITFKLSNLKSITGEYGNEEVKEAYFTYTKTFNDSRLKELPVDGTTYWTQAWNTNLGLAYMRFANFTMRWINVDKYSDDPNRYMAGDTMLIDATNGKVFLNDVPILNDVVKGSEFIKIPPGETEIQFAYSAFAVAPKVTASIREGYL